MQRHTHVLSWCWSVLARHGAFGIGRWALAHGAGCGGWHVGLESQFLIHCVEPAILRAPRMRAIIYDDTKKSTALVDDWAVDEGVQTSSCSPLTAVLSVNQVGVCNTDLEIAKGYVQGFRHVLGHEGVGVVDKIVNTKTRETIMDHPMLGKRVCVEINCPCAEESNEGCSDMSESVRRALEDPIFSRNHFPHRTVLGIIARDGLMAERCAVPLDNCVPVPEVLTDTEAAFSEPLAAALRVVEQNICCGGNEDQPQRIAVVGDGKLCVLDRSHDLFGLFDLNESLDACSFAQSLVHLLVCQGLADRSYAYCQRGERRVALRKART